jgi:hypothetical protein
MKLYTVLVARPDYVSDGQLGDLFRAWVGAKTPTIAAQIGQESAWMADNDDQPIEDNDCLDYRVIAIFEGHLNDVNPF